MRISAGKPAKVCAITLSDAGDEERHRRWWRSGPAPGLLTCWWLTCWWLTCWWLARRWLARRWRRRLRGEYQSWYGDKRQYRGSKYTLCAIHIYSPWQGILSKILR